MKVCLVGPMVLDLNFLFFLTVVEKAMKVKLLRSLSTLSNESDEGKQLVDKFSRQISSQQSLRHKKDNITVCTNKLFSSTFLTTKGFLPIFLSFSISLFLSSLNWRLDKTVVKRFCWGKKHVDFFKLFCA